MRKQPAIEKRREWQRNWRHSENGRRHERERMRRRRSRANPRRYAPLRWRTVLQVAVDLGVDKSTIYRAIRQGRLSAQLCHHRTGLGRPGYYIDPQEVRRVYGVG